MSRATSTLSSVSRTLLTITNAINLARLAGRGITSEQMELERQLAEEQRKFNVALDPETKQKAAEAIAILTQRKKELLEEQDNQKFMDFVTLIGSLSLAAGAAIKAVKDLAPEIPKLMTAIQGMSGRQVAGIAVMGVGAGLLATGGFDALMGKSDKLEDKLKGLGGIAAIGVGIALEFPALAKIALIGTAVAVATAAIILFRDEITGFFQWLGTQLGLDENSPFVKFFSETIPAALITAGQDLSNFFTKDLPEWASVAWTTLSEGFSSVWSVIIASTQGFINTIIGGIEFLINKFIEIINVMISSYNSVASLIGLGAVSHLKSVELPRLDLGNTGSSGNNNASPIQGNTASVGGSFAPHIEIHGSLLTEREFDSHIDNYLKEKLKTVGFTT